MSAVLWGLVIALVLLACALLALTVALVVVTRRPIKVVDVTHHAAPRGTASRSGMWPLS